MPFPRNLRCIPPGIFNAAIMEMTMFVKGFHSARRRLRDIGNRVSLRRVAGPRQFRLAPHDVVVISPVLNSAYWLREYLDHHRSLGAAGFVLIDSGSTDGTVDMLAAETDVIVLSGLSFAYQNDMREIAACRYAAGSWALFADTDEMFDPPGGMPLPYLARYLSQRDLTALPSLMLDLFPEGPVGGDDPGYASALRSFRWFEPCSIELRDYTDPSIPFRALLDQNERASGSLRMAFGGVRRRVFGENPCLTKHPLVRVAPGIRPGRHPHCPVGARIAGFHGVVRHYKFTNRPGERDAESASRGIVPHGEDKARLTHWRSGPVTLFSDRARRYEGPAQIAALGLIADRIEGER